MSLPDNPRELSAPRRTRARPRQSLKMQAIGFLSRREHSRQELRAKLLDSLRKRAREDAALESAAEALRQAALAQPSNGIDDAFAPRMPEPEPEPEPTPALSAARKRAPHASRAGAPASASARTLGTLTFATGAPLPATLRAKLDAVAAASDDSSAPEPVACDSGDVRDDVLPPDPVDDASLERTDPEAAVDRLLDWLVANKYLSDTRFVESRVNARSRKQGTLRIKLELSRHGLTLAPDQAATLRETEFARARDLWQRKFGEVAADPKQRARQARFLAARGFAADVVRRVVVGLDED